MTKKLKKSKSKNQDPEIMKTSEAEQSLNEQSKSMTEVQNLTSVPLPSKKTHTNETHECYLIELAPGINIHDLDGCKIKLPQITESSRQQIVEGQAKAETSTYDFEDPLVDTKLEDGDRVRKIRNCNEKLLYSSTVKNESELGQTMIVTQANNFEMTRPRKIMQPIDGQIAVTKDLLGQLGQLTASELSTPERLLPDHKAPTYNPDDRTKRHVDIGNFK